MSALNPQTKSFEFLGPPGAFFVSVTVPAVLYALYFACSEQSGGCPPLLPLSTIPDAVLGAFANKSWWSSLWDTQATIALSSWYAFCVLAWAVLPGDWVDGVTLRTGEKKKYKINGICTPLFFALSNSLRAAFSTFLLAMGIVSGVILRFGPESFTFIYDHWLGLVTASILFSFLQAAFCYTSSFRPGRLLALGGNSGNHIYDVCPSFFIHPAVIDLPRLQFFIGRELNPSIGSFDIKSFNELRPGLILWVLIDISMLCEQAVRRGGFARVTDSLWLVLAFHTWYVIDALYNEVCLPLGYLASLKR
jgi:Delta14-sterol reductase